MARSVESRSALAPAGELPQAVVGRGEGARRESRRRSTWSGRSASRRVAGNPRARSRHRPTASGPARSTGVPLFCTARSSAVVREQVPVLAALLDADVRRDLAGRAVRAASTASSRGRRAGSPAQLDHVGAQRIEDVRLDDGELLTCRRRRCRPSGSQGLLEPGVGDGAMPDDRCPPKSTAGDPVGRDSGPPGHALVSSWSEKPPSGSPSSC